MFCCLVRDPLSASVPGALEAVARACSPRVYRLSEDRLSEDAVVFDASGLTRMFGSLPEMTRQISRLAAERGMTVRVAAAGTVTAAWLLAHAQPGTTVVPAGSEAAALAPLAMKWLTTLTGTRHWARGTRKTSKFELRRSNLVLVVLDRWGLRTLGDLARLPRAGVLARLGPTGTSLHQAACGEDDAPLVPTAPGRRFVEHLALEWPIDSLEPLSFVLARLCEALTSALAQADRGAIVVRTTLGLVTRRVHERTLHLSAPMGDARLLRTLILLDLESHPPNAAIDTVEIEVDVAPGPIVQGSLLTRALPSAGDVAILVARLGALVGEVHVGAPALVDTDDERRVVMRKFTVSNQGKGQRAEGRGREKERREKDTNLCPVSLEFPLPFAFCPLPFRRFRPPLAARVEVERGAPLRVAAGEQARGRVINWAGPWRTSGRWWALDRSDWDRDEWEIELAAGGVYRLARHRTSGAWEIEGAID